MNILAWIIVYLPLLVQGLRIPVFYDSQNGLHRDLSYHPEQPARIDACVELLSQSGIDLEDASFSDQELTHAREMLCLAHSDDYVQKIQDRCQLSRQQRIDEGKDPLGFAGYLDGGDTYLTTESYDVCLRATAAWIKAIDRAGMALTRPPGHHATAKLANGFCLFNFAAAAVLHVLQSNPKARVSVLDWDVHYGQGVADILQHHERARYVSIHQTPAFPYMGEKKQTQGAHQNVQTIPVPPDTTWTCGYEECFRQALDYVYQPNEWEPDVVLICAGYDALDSDELASCSLQAVDYGRMTKLLQKHLPSKTRIAFGLEGGYQLSPMAGGGNLPQAVLETLQALR